MNSEKKGFLRKLISVLTTIVIVMTSFQYQGLTAQAASHKLSAKAYTSSHIVTYHWKGSAKFGSGKGLDYIKENACVLLHYLDGDLGQCVYAEQDTPEGAAKEFNVKNDERTSWMYEEKAGYDKYKYVGLAQEYLITKKVSLSGITNSKKLMSLDKRDRKMLAQGFAWYMQHGSYNRTKGETVKLISNISGFPAAKQVVLYDEIYTAAKTALKNYKISQKTYKLVSGGNSHQPIAVFKVVADFEPIKKSVSVKDFDSTTQKVNLKIDKIDAVKRTGLPNATFKVTCDGKEVAQITTGEGGSIDYTYSRKLTTKTYTVSKSYIENWDDLDSTQRKKLTQNGYYQNKSAAIKAGRAELKKKLTAELNSLKSKTHTWKIEEVKAPFGHKVSNSIQTATEKSQNKYLYFQFTDLPEKRTLTIQKDSETGEYGVEATLANAVYGLYAAENILDTDNKTVLYKADEKVTELTTDKDGQATVSELKPGKYYLQEIEAPEGYLLSDKKYPVDLSSSDQTEDVTDTLITGRILIHKTYGTEKLPEKSAEFILYNSNNETVDTLTIDENGDAQSKELPYGNYRIEQTKGMDGYAFLPTQIIKIDGSKAEYTISANDEPEYAGIAISKTIHCDDQETNSVWNEAEKDAEFEIQDASGKTVETLVTDEHGFAVSGELEPGIYTVHQTKGAENYEKVKDFQVTIKAGDHKILQYDLADENIATKIRLKKVTVKDEEETEEAEAKFIILDQSLAKDIDKADLSTGTKRRLYTLSLPREAIVGRMTTDKNGEASMLLNKLDAGKKFIVLQWAGADGYALMDPYYSEKDTPVMENGHPTYTIQGKDEFEDYAYIKIKKSMVTDRVNDKAVTEAERDAEFEIIDMNGDTVETLITNESGEAVSGKLPYGTYMIHQISGNDTHELAEDQEVTLSKSNKKEPVTVSFENEEKPVEVILTKRSSETQILLSNASYDIYNEKGEKVASITTGEEKEGVASCKLPYGKYYLKETVSPDGYKCSKEKTFEVNFETAEKGTLSLTDMDEPVYGKIAITKTGDVLTGFSMDNFQYSTGEVEEAVYGLYAEEDILADDGSLLWEADEQITKKATNKKGIAQFTRTLKDGTETDGFPQGKYYIKELEAPYGYQLDDSIYEIVITWDTKANDYNEITKPNPDTDTEDPKPITYPEANSGKYILESGGKFHNDMGANMKTVVFSNKKAPDGIDVKDVSSLKDGSVVMWSVGAECIVSTQNEEQDVILNTDSSFMFLGRLTIENIYFDAADTSGLINATGMFQACTNLTELDLTNFDTRSLKYVKNMFRGCTKLTTIYANTEIVKSDPTTPQSVEVKVEPKYEFVVGTKYEADDFTFKLVYDDGSEKEVAVTDKEVEIDPDTASPVGEQQVGFTFKSGECSKFGSVETTVKVVDAPDADKSQPEDVEVNLDVEDTLITHTIRIAKEDESGNPVAGATFGLYAAKDIIAKNGNVLFRVNELIAMAKSELTSEGDAAVVTFSNLPSDLNASGSGRMYYVREIQAAPGYAIGEMSGKTLGYSGSVESYNGEVAGVIHDYEKSGIIADIAYKNEYSAVTNKKLTKVVIQKIWDDENNIGNRPKSITIRATNGSQTKDYTLTAENNWMVDTDIPVEEIDDWEFEELSFNGSDKYNTSQKKDPETNVITFTNKLKKVYKNFVVLKVWDDGDDQDGIRPESVKVNLYRNGKYFDSTELNESNNWKDNTKFRRLDAENDEGVEYTYEIKEESTDLINGNSKTGYEISYAEEDQTDTDGTAYTNVAITNTHVPGKSKIVIHKKIDGDVNWNLGNPEFTFLITGTTLQGDDVKLRKKITFNKDEIEQLLSESKDGKVTKDLIFDDLDPGTYTVTEEDDNPYYELEKIESTDTGISIDKNKITYQLGRKDGSLAGRTKDGEVTFYNKERSGSVEINKKDDSGKALESVGFALYDQDHNLIQSGKTDTDGKLKFTGLPIGSYWLEETNTVSGKNKLSKALKITVPLQMTQDEVDAKKADTSKGIKIGGEYYFYQLTYDITNSAILNIPKAGALEQYPWLLPAMICIALGLVGMRNRKRKGSEQDEKEQEK